MTLSLARLNDLLRTRWLGRSAEYLDLTDSTNDDAWRAAAQGAPDGHLVLTDGQRAGRGTHGRQWSSPSGEDLYFSVLLCSGRNAPRSSLPVLALASGVAVAETVDALLCPSAEDARDDHPGQARIKWPNDVLLGDRKVAGILLEGSTQGYEPATLVLGIGLNVNRTTWAVPLADSATSLLQASRASAPLERIQVLAALLNRLELWVDRFRTEEGPRAAIAAVEERLYGRGRWARCGQVEGRLLGLAPSGAARLRDAKGRAVEIWSGSLEFR